MPGASEGSANARRSAGPESLDSLVKAQWETSASNRRVRTYRITPAGIKHLYIAAVHYGSEPPPL